ncbi:MAG: hypothetical protein Q9171_004195 [Xanthocarpia ochracea]
MAKRKHVEDDLENSAGDEDSEQEFSGLEESSSEGSEDVQSLPFLDQRNHLIRAKEYDEIRVEFEWFDPQKQDFEGFQMLLRQLLGTDASFFHLGAIADLILEQKLLGSTVKTDGNEGDPHSLLTVLNLKQHRNKPVIKSLVDYLLDRAATSSSLSPLISLLAANGGNEIGLILSERWVNIATEVVPPMYEMLLEEIEWAVDDKEPYTFTHYLIWSKIYHAVPSTLDETTNRPLKKMKPVSSKDVDDGQSMYYFHPEDEVLHRYAMLHGNFDYKTPVPEGDSRNAFQDFGVTPHGHLILLDATALKTAVQALKVEFPFLPTTSGVTMDESWSSTP